MSESSPGRIFISYRRQETAWPAGRLYDVLVEHFAAEQVFKDVDNIEPGEDFVERITAAVAYCDVLLALIGPQWLTMTDENGDRRLDNPEDFVRLEIEVALKRKIRVIPILVDGARMPRANELPPTLAPLVRRNALEINPLTFDTRRLMTAVQKTLAEERVTGATTGSTPTAEPDGSDLQGADAEGRTLRQAEDRARREAEQKAKPEAQERSGRDAEQKTKAQPKAVAPAGAAAWRPSRRTAYLAIASVLAILGILLAFLGRESPKGQGDATPTPTPTKTAAPPAPLKWQRGTDLPEPLEAAGVTVFSDAVWVVGGNAPSAGRPTLDKVWLYESGWQPGPKLPVRLDSIAVASDGDRLFVVGGRTTDSEGKNQKISRDVWVLDGPNDDNWEVLNRLPEERAGGAVAWDGQRLVFAGGLNRKDLDGDGKAENVNHADVWVWEGKDEWREIGQLQRQREDLVAASDGNGRVWFLGGADARKEDPRVPLGAVDLVEKNRITPLSNIDPVRSSAAVWLADRGVCLFGGVTRTMADSKNSLENEVVCVPETASPSPTSRPLPPMTLPRAGLGAVVSGEKIWLVGGFGPKRKDGPIQPGLSVVEVLDL